MLLALIRMDVDASDHESFCCEPSWLGAICTPASGRLRPVAQVYADKTLDIIRADPVAGSSGAKASGPMPQSIHQAHCAVDIWQPGNLFHLGQPALYKTRLNLCDGNISKHPYLQPLLGFDPAAWYAAKAWAAMEEAGGPETAAQVGFGAPAMQRPVPAAGFLRCQLAGWRQLHRQGSGTLPHWAIKSVLLVHVLGLSWERLIGWRQPQGQGLCRMVI